MKKFSTFLFALLLTLSLPITFNSAFADSHVQGDHRDSSSTVETSKVAEPSSIDSTNDSNSTENSASESTNDNGDHQTNDSSSTTAANNQTDISNDNSGDNNQTGSQSDAQTNTDTQTPSDETVPTNHGDSNCLADSTHLTFESDADTNVSGSLDLTIPGGEVHVETTCSTGTANFFNFYRFKYTELFKNITNTSTIVKHISVFHHFNDGTNNSENMRRQDSFNSNYQSSAYSPNDVSVLGASQLNGTQPEQSDESGFPFSENSIAFLLTSIGSVLLMTIRRNMFVPF